MPVNKLKFIKLVDKYKFIKKNLKRKEGEKKTLMLLPEVIIIQPGCLLLGLAYVILVRVGFQEFDS